jgi:hypothetical protein
VPAPFWWVASYANPPQATIPAGAVAHQYADPTSSGGDFDISVCVDSWPPSANPLTSTSGVHGMKKFNTTDGTTCCAWVSGDGHLHIANYDNGWHVDDGSPNTFDQPGFAAGTLPDFGTDGGVNTVYAQTSAGGLGVVSYIKGKGWELAS